MAEERGLRARIVVPVPVLTPRLSSLWIHLVTPVSARIARPLAEGLRNRVVCRDDAAARLMPQHLLSVREAIRASLDAVQRSEVETAWSDAGRIPGDPDWAGGTVFVDRRVTEVAAAPAHVFRAVSRVGGARGWYAADWLWRLRGLVDRLVGGPGLRRGRRNPDHLAFGEAVDFWRVTGIERDRRLALRAEMKLPGEALLEWIIEPLPGATPRSRLVQVARFLPRGLLGLAYWYAVLPVHGYVFGRMLAGIRRAAERMAADDIADRPDRVDVSPAIDGGARIRSATDAGPCLAATANRARTDGEGDARGERWVRSSRAKGGSRWDHSQASGSSSWPASGRDPWEPCSWGTWAPTSSASTAPGLRRWTGWPIRATPCTTGAAVPSPSISSIPRARPSCSASWSTPTG